MGAYDDRAHRKESILSVLKAHREANEIVRGPHPSWGAFWENGEGCAVGCTIHKSCEMTESDTTQYDLRFGIPEILAHLENVIFYGLPTSRAKEWPEQFMGAINVGADLSLVHYKFLHWLLTDEEANPGISHPSVRQEIKFCADVIYQASCGFDIHSRTVSLWSEAESTERRGRGWWSRVWNAQGARSPVALALNAMANVPISVHTVGPEAESAQSAEYAAQSAEGLPEMSQISDISEIAHSVEHAAESVAKSASKSVSRKEESEWVRAFERKSAYIVISKKLVEILKEA